MAPEAGDEDGWVLFSGAPREGDIAHQAAQRGINLRRIDLLNAGVDDDVLEDKVFEGIATRMRARASRPGKGFLAVAIPCRSFSPARRHRVRVKGLPWGPAQGLNSDQRRFLDRENDIVRRALALMLIALSLGFEVVFEHPAKTNDSRLRFFNRRAKRCASIFDLDVLQHMETEFGMLFVEFPQCALLGLTMKPTRLLYTHRLHVILGPLGSLDCDHRPGGHPGGQAYGRDKRGRSLSAQTAAYPFAMAAVIADCCELAQGCPRHQLRLRPKVVSTTSYPVTSDDDSDVIPLLVSHSETSEDDTGAQQAPTARRRAAPRSDTEPSARSGSASCGGTTEEDVTPDLVGPSTPSGDESTHPSGLARTGPRLGATVARAVHEARHTPPSFASLRNAVAADESELLSRSMRDDTVAAAHMSQQHPPHPLRQPGQPFGRPAPNLADLPQGPITIQSLFLPGVWQRVLDWFAAADGAMEALLRGEYAAPGTLVITQDEMQVWARGILWDCTDPIACVPAKPSSAEGLAGARGRKLDAAVLRQMADEIGWDDPDILDQADNGFESHSSCSLTTVLAFHHTGVAKNYDAAEKVIESDIDENWVKAAVRWLPRVPLRCLARNVIVTEKARTAPDGCSIEYYQKARVSTDASESKSPDSPNGGTPKADTMLDLCTAKDMGAGAAIVSLPAGGLDRVGLAAIDLESAFRFLLLQWLELWLHAFLWWTGGRHGAAEEEHSGQHGKRASPSTLGSTLVGLQVQTGFNE